MKKQHSAFIEHNLVPATLFLLNICLIHVVYAFAAGSMYPPLSTAVLVTALIFLGGSLISKKQLLLMSSIVFYILTVMLITTML